MIFKNDYRLGLYPFPAHDIDPMLKQQKEWNLAYAKAIYALYINNRTLINENDIKEFAIHRKYALGKQDTNKYKDQMFGTSEEGLRKGYTNINFDIIAIAPKYRNIIVEMFADMEFDTIIEAIDPESNNKKEEEKYKMIAKSIIAPHLKEISKNANVEFPDDNETEYNPTTINEIEIYEKLGGFKLKEEIKIETLIKQTLYNSNSTYINRKVIEDLVDIGIAIIKPYYDFTTGEVKIRYCDPQNFVGQYTEKDDNETSTFQGEIVDYTIAELRVRTGLTEEELRKIVRTYENINQYSISDYNKQYNGAYAYDNMIVKVLECEYISIDNEYYIERINAQGNKLMYKTKYGNNVNTEKKTTKIYNIQQVYQCKWIIGTDYIFDYGLKNNIIRKNDKEVLLGYRVVRMKDKSLIARIEPFIDNMQLAWLKFQNALALSAPSGIRIEWSSLQNMTLGGKKIKELELLKIRRETGDLIYRATTLQGAINYSLNTGERIEGGVGNVLNEFINIFEFNRQQIQDLMGLNQVTASGIVEKYTLSAAPQTAMQTTTASLKSILYNYIRLKTKTSKYLSVLIPISIKYYKEAYNYYKNIIGEVYCKIFKEKTEYVTDYYNVIINIRPTEQQRAQLLQTATEAIKSQMLDFATYMMIFNNINTANLKYLEFILVSKMEENRLRQQEAQQQQMMIQQQMAAQDLQMRTQLKQAEIEGKSNAKRDEIIIQSILNNPDLANRLYEELMQYGKTEVETSLAELQEYQQQQEMQRQQEMIAQQQMIQEQQKEQMNKNAQENKEDKEINKEKQNVVM